MPVTLPRSLAAHPTFLLSVPVNVALAEFLVKVTTCPSRAVKVREVLPAVRVLAKPIGVSRLKQFEPSACSARGGVIAICAPHSAHDTEGTNTNTNTHDAPQTFRTNRQQVHLFAAFLKKTATAFHRFAAWDILANSNWYGQTRRHLLNWCEISSAVSTVLDAQKFAVAVTSSAEQCGYGDLY